MVYHQVDATDEEIDAGSHFACIGKLLQSQGLFPVRHWDDGRDTAIVDQLAAAHQAFEQVVMPAHSPKVRKGVIWKDRAAQLRFAQVQVAVAELQDDAQLLQACQEALTRTSPGMVMLVVDEGDPLFQQIVTSPLPADGPLKMADRLAAHIAYVRKRLGSTERLAVAYGGDVDLLLQPASPDGDSRVDIRCRGLGSTTVNYRPGGLHLEVTTEAGHHYDTWEISVDQLGDAYEAAPAPRQR